MPSSDAESSRHSFYFMRNWFGFFIMGLSTTLPYTVVTTAAYSIAKSFEHDYLLGMIYGVSGSATFLVKVLNAFFMTRVSYSVRFYINSLFILGGLAGIAFAPQFLGVVTSTILVGLASAFGENVALGYLSKRGFDSDLVTAWASGTGLAGLVGSSIYLLIGCIFIGNGGNIKKVDRWAFSFISPVVLLYLASALRIIVEPQSFNRQIQKHGPGRPEGSSQPQEEEDDPSRPLLAGRINEEEDNPDDISILIRSGAWKQRLKYYWKMLKIVSALAINLAFSSFLAYITRFAASKVKHKDGDYSTCPEVYASLQLCYQAGVFTSKSSLQLCKVNKVAYLTLLQFGVALLWSLNQHYKFLPIYSLPSLMIIAGLLSGAVYVNTFYKVQTEDDYKEDRELCTNITAIFINVGLSFSAIFTTLLYTTVLYKD